MTLGDIMDLLEDFRKDSTLEEYNLLMNNIKVVNWMLSNTKSQHRKIQLRLMMELLK
jgi:hypothetical protein